MRDPRHPHWPEAGERTELRDVAERWKWAYVDLAHEQHRHRVLGRRDPKKLGPSIEAYLRHRETAVEPRTFAGDRSVLTHLEKHFRAAQYVHTVDVQKLVDALLSKGYKPSTVQQYTMNLRAFWRWLDLPFPDVTVPDPGSEGVRYWTDEEAAALRAHARTMEPAVLVALDCTLFMGLRLGELSGLEWPDIAAAEEAVTVRRQIPQGRTTPKPLKGKAARTALILPGWEHTGSYGLVVTRDGSPVGRRVTWRWMKTLLEATGLQGMGVGWHTGRHTYARGCLEGGVTMEQLSKFLGHRSITTTERSYGWMRPGKAIEAARRTLRRG